jgi:Flp pilus assembly protein CpaB
MKQKSNSILPILLVAGAAFVLTFFFLTALRADTSVVVAARPIAVGARLTENDVKVVQMRSADVLPGAIKKVEDAVGKLSGAQRLAGDQLTADSIGDKASSAIAGGLGPDKRAVAVRVDIASGLAGVIRAGDLVSLVAVVTPPQKQNQQAQAPAVKPITTTVQVKPTEHPGLAPITPFSRLTATGLKVLLVPQTFRYREASETDKEGFAPAQTVNIRESSVVVLEVPIAPIAVQGANGTLSVSLPELLPLLDANGKLYLVLEPPTSSKSQTIGVAIEQLVDVLGVSGAVK